MNQDEILNRLAMIENMLFSLHQKIETQQNPEFQVFSGLLTGSGGKVKDELSAWQRLKTIAEHQINIIKAAM